MKLQKINFYAVTGISNFVLILLCYHDQQDNLIGACND